MGQPSLQERWNLTRTLCHSDDLHCRANGAVDDEVSAHRKEQHRKSGKVLALMANAGCPPDGLECIEAFIDPAVGCVDIVLSDVFPDFV